MIQVNPFISKVIGVAVVLIVIVSVAVPVISTLTQPETISNDAELRYSLYAAEDVPSFTIAVDSETQTITMNGEAVDWPAQDSGYRAMIIAVKENDRVAVGGISNDCTIAGFGEDGTITWSLEERKFTVTHDGSGVISPDINHLIMPDTNGGLGSFVGQFWGQSGQPTYVIFTTPADYINIVRGVNDETMTGSNYHYSITATPLDSRGDAYMYDISQINVASIDHTPGYEAVLAIGDIDIVVEESNPIMDMINLVPLLLVVGLIIAAVAAFITLKSRGGGA